LDRFKQKTKYVWHCQTDKLPSKVLKCPGTKGPKPQVVSLSQLMEMTSSVRPWKHPHEETSKAYKAANILAND
jgi:hypothetical protein